MSACKWCGLDHAAYGLTLKDRCNLVMSRKNRALGTSMARLIEVVNTPVAPINTARYTDRHSPGYMAKYMRDRRATATAARLAKRGALQ